VKRAGLTVDTLVAIGYGVNMVDKNRAKLRDARLLARMSAADAASRVGIGRTSLTHYETGRRSLDPATIARLLAIYKKTRQALARP
jgi:transcriptional regulator with XRE-family HTH domain